MASNQNLPDLMMSWRGKKTLRFKLQQLSVRSNLSRLWANGEFPELLT